MSSRYPGLAVYAGLVAFSAYAGALGLATGAIDMGHRLDQRLPFDSPVLGALALVIIVAIPSTALAWQAARGASRTGATAVVAGVLLIGWIAVELAFIREFSWLQPVYVAIGISFVVIGRRLDAHRSLVVP